MHPRSRDRSQPLPLERALHHVQAANLPLFLPTACPSAARRVRVAVCLSRPYPPDIYVAGYFDKLTGMVAKLEWSRKSRPHARFCQRAWGLRAICPMLQNDVRSHVPFGRVMSELRITGTLISAGRLFGSVSRRKGFLRPACCDGGKSSRLLREETREALGAKKAAEVGG
jgi:hypothetical protein